MTKEKKRSGRPAKDKIAYLKALIVAEMARAEDIHGPYPEDILRGAAIMCEEAGEVLEQALDFTRVKKRNFPMTEDILGITLLRTEVVQTIVCGLNYLYNIEENLNKIEEELRKCR